MYVYVQAISKQRSRFPHMTWEVQDVLHLTYPGPSHPLPPHCHATPGLPSLACLRAVPCLSDGAWLAGWLAGCCRGVCSACSFDVVLDKSLIDTLMCFKDAKAATHAMVRELRRVLRPGGLYVTLSLHTEQARQQQPRSTPTPFMPHARPRCSSSLPTTHRP